MPVIGFLHPVLPQVRRWIRAPIGYAVHWRERLSARYRYELAVCAIFREEAPFLDEWLTFHSGIGATHFYLYNNFSTDNSRDVLQPWIARGVVTLTDWQVPVGQLSAYRHCIKRARSQCRWLAFIDIDEFLFSPQSQTTDIRGILRQYTDLPGVEVWQAFFGSAGHDARPNLPVTEAYLKRAALSQTTVKSISNPRMIYKVGIHQSKYWIGEGLDTSRRSVRPGLPPVLDMLRINHYWSRSIDDMRTKIQRNDASTPVVRDAKWHFEFEKSLNAETDDSILRTARSINAASRVVQSGDDAR
jgi:Glycosyltransferase family 92